jgi:hypothetical protein
VEGGAETKPKKIEGSRGSTEVLQVEDIRALSPAKTPRWDFSPAPDSRLLSYSVKSFVFSGGFRGSTVISRHFLVTTVFAAAYRDSKANLE